MPLPTLDALTAVLDSTAVALLGDPLTYVATAGAAPVARGFVDFGESARDFGASAAVEREITVELRIADVPARPTSAARISFGAMPGATFQPIDITREGTMWRFGVKAAAGA